MAIKVFNHEHALWLDQKKRDDTAECDACSSICIGPTYSCRECSLFHLHESCSKLQQELHTLFHQNPLRLTLQVGHKQRCHACAVHPSRCFFRCDECNFPFDAKCAFIKPATEQMEEQFRTHFGHQHPLLLLENMPNDRVVIRAFSYIYKCLKCVETPISPPKRPNKRSMVTPYKPRMSLSLSHMGLLNTPPHVWAGISVTIIVGRSQEPIIDHRSFQLHRECNVVLKPAMEYEGHTHPLQFRMNIGDTDLKYCSACNSICKSHVFSRFDCRDFNLHLTCDPLPYSIKHNCHIDSLILTNALAKHEDETDDEFSCDACQETRDPRLPTYQCEDCYFVAEVKCVMSKVISTLEEKYGPTELRSPLGQLGRLITKDIAKHMVPKKEDQLEAAALTLGEILNSLSEDEENELCNGLISIFFIRKEGSKAIDQEKVLQFSDEAYSQFMKFLDHGMKFLEECQSGLRSFDSLDTYKILGQNFNKPTFAIQDISF
ncbi:uncharacterized protein LOC122312583 [Carya illinoinensis]|uniref:uncharacterized protein LOC122312583 n=1 Tax=Carya illinoinensis TaxID=32201 RepID=UPI001C72966D|nr:uncharacterized protein LOC122312583 [Carya illinoinensis]